MVWLKNAKFGVRMAGLGLLAGGAGWLCLARGQACRMEGGSQGSQTSEEEFWTWGNGIYIPQPDFRTQFANFIPHRKTGAINQSGDSITFEPRLPRFTCLTFRESKAYGVGEDGVVYAYDNDQNPSFIRKRTTYQLGVELIDETQLIKNLRPLGFPDRAKTVGITNKYLWGLSTNGDLYTLNIDDNAPKKSQKWTKFQAPAKLQDVTFGQDHLLMLAANGDLYSIGDNSDGQCGVKNDDPPTPDGSFKIQRPVRVRLPHDKRVTKIYSKFNQNIIVTDDGEAFAFGSNNRMQLGFYEEFSRQKDPLLKILEPRSLKNDLDGIGCHIKDVAIGKDFTFFQCINRSTGLEQVYGVGSSAKGQLARGTFHYPSNYELVDTLSDMTIEQNGSEVPLGLKRLACGSSHCVALIDMDGPLLIWGSNEVGQIGNRDNRPCDRPKIVSLLKHATILDLFVDDTTTAVYARPRPQTAPSN